LLVAALHMDPHERAGQGLRLPRRGGFAGAQLDDDVAPARRLAGAQSDVADDAVALVEDAEHRHPLRHWRDAGLGAHRRGGIGGGGAGHIALVVTAAACGERQRQQQRGGRASHAYCGIQGS
jgi:hypothetical protein